MPPNVRVTPKGKLYSELWGECQKTPNRFPSEWARIRATGKKIGLPREARKRLEWIIWYETFGECNARATCRHFGISPKVFYYWRKRFFNGSLYDLQDLSHRPYRTRASELSSLQIGRIVQLRRQYMCYSKMKLAILYREEYNEPISTWKIQRVIQEFKLYPNRKKAESIARKRKRAWQKKRITELGKVNHAGFLFCIDTIVRHIDGQHCYIFTAIDRYSRFAFAHAYSHHSSAAAADFLRKLHEIVEGKVVNIQTDNGSEFHLHFAQAAKELGIQHWWSRVRTPKDNAVCERFNRTLQEEFIGQGNAISNVHHFNKKLIDWIIEYDFHRPHAALNYKRPIELAAHREVLPIYSSRAVLAF
jgi:transposase InsO family protein